MTSHLSRAKPPPHLMDRLWIGPSYLDAHTTHRKPKKRLGGVTPATDERGVRRMRKRRSLLTRTKGGGGGGGRGGDSTGFDEYLSENVFEKLKTKGSLCCKRERPHFGERDSKENEVRDLL